MINYVDYIEGSTFSLEIAENFWAQVFAETMKLSFMLLYIPNTIKLKHNL